MGKIKKYLQQFIKLLVTVAVFLLNSILFAKILSFLGITADRINKMLTMQKE
jgi:Mg2+/citrate symporter